MVPNCVPEQLSFQISGGNNGEHKKVQKKAKIRNLFTGTTNPNERDAAERMLPGPKLPFADSYTPKSFSKFMIEASAAWQRKEGKNSKGGLNAAGVASYRAQNPGSKLQTAVTTKPSKLKPGSKDAKRRKSFCSRSAGQMKMWKKAAKDPNSRLRLARRKWNS